MIVVTEALERSSLKTKPAWEVIYLLLGLGEAGTVGWLVVAFVLA